MKLTKESVMNEVDHDKVSLAFGLYVISQISEDKLVGYLNSFKEMFFDTLRDSKKSSLPKTDDVVVQQHNDNTIEKEVEVSAHRNIMDLEKTMLDLRTDKDSWKKIFMEKLKWV